VALFQELCCCAFFFISTTSTVKKSNPITEPHGSPQGCTVRPEKGAGQCSMGGGAGGGGQGAFSILRFEHLWISDSMIFRSLVVSCVRTRVLFFINYKMCVNGNRAAFKTMPKWLLRWVGVGTCSNMHKLQTLMGSRIAIWYNSLPNVTQNPTHHTQMFKNKRITKSLMTKAPNLF
jgi:hypothetical protein